MSNDPLTVGARSSRQARITLWLDAIATAAIVATCVGLGWFLVTFTRGTDQTTTSLPKAPVDLANAPRRGNSTTPSALIVFSDFLCPVCSRFARETLPRLEQDYVASGRLQIVFWHLPLTRIHPMAVPAAFASECAGRYGLFWKMHDQIFLEPPQSINESRLRVLALQAGVSAGQLAQCSEPEVSAAITRRIESRTHGARAMGFSATPSLVLARKQSGELYKLLSQIPLSEYSELAGALDEALRK